MMGGIRNHLTIQRDALHRTKTRSRTTLLSLGLALTFAAIGVRLVDLGFANSDEAASIWACGLSRQSNF